MISELRPGTVLTATATTTAQPLIVRTTSVINGTVWYVSGNYVILTLPSGENRDYIVPRSFRFIVEGKPASVTDLRKGMKVSGGKNCRRAPNGNLDQDCYHGQSSALETDRHSPRIASLTGTGNGLIVPAKHERRPSNTDDAHRTRHPTARGVRRIPEWLRSVLDAGSCSCFAATRDCSGTEGQLQDDLPDVPDIGQPGQLGRDRAQPPRPVSGRSHEGRFRSLRRRRQAGAQLVHARARRPRLSDAVSRSCSART